ncbi:hypothetical protein [uncultured Muribaculum sp.]|uniref:hypothetical protein n=1 Tax=uncultured Muribaculum sp. TaxID=1918613 RepID=UPI0025B784B6|nr:hypothetical protein [uncultured Muribaculum sp.]
MTEERIEMMRERHDSFKKLIEGWGLPSAGDFYHMFQGFLKRMGNEIHYSNSGDGYGDVNIIIHMPNGDTEEYSITSKRGTGYAKVSPVVVCTINGISTEIDIFGKNDETTRTFQ